MKIESSSYETYLEALEAWQEKMQQAKMQQTEESSSETDTYISGLSAEDLPIPTSNYNASGMMADERPPMPPMPPVEEMEETSSESTSKSSEEEILSQLSDTFRANADSILSTMDELGLSIEDLEDEENLKKLAAAMNEGAANLGLPTAGDTDTLVEQLKEALASYWDNYSEEEVSEA